MAPAKPKGRAAALHAPPTTATASSCFRARVFVNGREVALAEPKGMFLRRRLDITEQLGFAVPGGQQGAPAQLQRQNATRNATLTVLVAPPDNVGDVDLGCGLRSSVSAAP